jgi:hypothetical protein
MSLSRTVGIATVSGRTIGIRFSSGAIVFLFTISATSAVESTKARIHFIPGYNSLGYDVRSVKLTTVLLLVPRL